MDRGLLAVGATLVLLAAACSADPPDPDSAPAPPATSEEPTTTEAEEPGDEPETTAGEPGRPGPGGPLRLEEIASGLDTPVHAAAAPGEDGRLYVVEQAGRIRVLQGRRLLDEPFLDIVSEVQSGGERGLLSVAFHPDYAANGLFYVYYTNRSGDTRVEEFRATGSGVPESQRILLAVEQPYGNHNGGQLAFGPDGLLYAGLGDGGSAGDPENRAQRLSSQLGKLLRLDVDDPRSEWSMVAYGLRNPWRFSFDRVTGDLWIGDVGQDRLEEIDYVPAGELGELLNFGWDVYEASDVYEDKQPTPGGRLVEPVTEYTHDFGCSVTGGFVYRGERIRREAGGRYFYGDFCSGRIWSLALWNGEAARRGHPFRVPGLTSFAEDANGELHLLSEGGSVYRLARAT